MGEKLRAGTLYFINNEGEFKKLGIPVTIQEKSNFFSAESLEIEVSNVVDRKSVV